VQTYIINERFGAYLEEVEWNFAEFLGSGKERFRTFYKGRLKLS